MTKGKSEGKKKKQWRGNKLTTLVLPGYPTTRAARASSSFSPLSVIRPTPDSSGNLRSRRSQLPGLLPLSLDYSNGAGHDYGSSDGARRQRGSSYQYQPWGRRVMEVDALEAADKIWGRGKSCHTGRYRTLNITDLKQKNPVPTLLCSPLPDSLEKVR